MFSTLILLKVGGGGGIQLLFFHLPVEPQIQEQLEAGKDPELGEVVSQPFTLTLCLLQS